MQYNFRDILRKYEIDFQENCTVTATLGSHLRANPKEINKKQLETEIYKIGKSNYKQQKIKSFKI